MMGRMKSTIFEDDAQDEYEELYPYEQEYQSWMNSIEEDFKEECEERSGIKVTKKSNFIFEIDEDLSPFNTINS